jgi:hypothetical protein
MIHHEPTTSSPQKYHQKKARFLKPPPKNGLKLTKKAPATAGAFFNQNPQISKR